MENWWVEEREWHYVGVRWKCQSLSGTIVGGMCAWFKVGRSDGWETTERDIYEWMLERKSVLLPKRRKRNKYDSLKSIQEKCSFARALLEHGKQEWTAYVKNFNTGGSDPRSDHQDETGRQKDRVPWKLSCKAKAKFTSCQTPRYKRLEL